MGLLNSYLRNVTHILLLIGRKFNMLSTSYIIMEKTLALHIKHILAKIIFINRPYSFEEVYILDIVIIVWEDMEWVRSTNLDTLFIKNDFKSF